jgi:hypothetical protein
LPDPHAADDRDDAERAMTTDAMSSNDSLQEVAMTDGTVTASACEELAVQWLNAEQRARTEPTNEAVGDEAVRLGEAYDEAIGAASQEELRLAWETAQRHQAAEEIGSRAWADARRVSELLRTEYQAARTRDTTG